MNIRHQFAIITYIMLVAMTITGALAHGPDDGHDHPPISLGPAEPAAPPGHITPISPGLIDATVQKSDEEFKAEILRHTHVHTHKDFESRITRLEVRINEVIELCNKMMPMLLGNIQQSTDATAIAQGAAGRVKAAEEKLTNLNSTLLDLWQRHKATRQASDCATKQIEYIEMYLGKQKEGISMYWRPPTCEDDQ